MSVNDVIKNDELLKNFLKQAGPLDIVELMRYTRDLALEEAAVLVNDLGYYSLSTLIRNEKRDKKCTPTST